MLHIDLNNKWRYYGSLRKWTSDQFIEFLTEMHCNKDEDNIDVQYFKSVEKYNFFFVIFIFTIQ